MSSSKKISEIFTDYFESKNKLIQHSERESAYREFIELAYGVRPAAGTKLEYIVHTLSRSSTIEMDVCSVKKQGNEYVFFFEFSLRISENLISGIFEAGDDGVHLGTINCFTDSGVGNFEWLNEKRLENFKTWLTEKNHN